MKYANWTSKKEIKEITTEVNTQKQIKKTGLQLMNEGNNLYLYEDRIHTLVIGASGSGKTQCMILPYIKLAMKTEESMIINDVKGELYERLGKTLEKKGYNVKVINFENPNYGSSWNPLILPYKLYKNGQKDKAIELTETIGYYLFKEKEKKPLDPFWNNSSMNYFTGLALYLYENAKEEEINIKSIYSLAQDISKDILKKLEKTNPIYMNLVGTLNAPPETKGSILSTFNQKIKLYLNKESLSNMLSSNDINLTTIQKEKTALFIVSGINTASTNLIPLLINQTYEAVQLEKQERTLNILLDEFDELLPIKDFIKIIHYSRSLNIKYTVIIKSFLNLINTYGPEEQKLIKGCFNAIVYLYSNDQITLDEISKMCGKSSEKEMLITSEESKLLKMFEAIILLPRMNPIRTNLIPDYKINWNEEFEETKLIEIPKKEASVYNSVKSK